MHFAAFAPSREQYVTAVVLALVNVMVAELWLVKAAGADVMTGVGGFLGPPA